MNTRRQFLKRSSATMLVASTGLSLRAFAEGLHLPLGLQLYSVREMLPKDYQGTLDMVGRLGYKEVEAAGFYNKSAAEVKQDMEKAKLKCVSAHYPMDNLQKNFDSIVQFHKELGAEYIICSSPGFRNPGAGGRERVRTMDDWRWNADQFNSFGAKASAAGLRFGYHNHTPEFVSTEGAVPYLELLKRTDPAHVTMELDCGWAVVSGANPVELLRDYPTRISMLHLKDFVKPATQTTNRDAFKNTELGRGFIDYGPIFAQAAKSGHVKHAFVEQEGFDVPAEESLKIDAEYVRSHMGK